VEVAADPRQLDVTIVTSSATSRRLEQQMTRTRYGRRARAASSAETPTPAL
jgi:hypothetical protein